LDYGSFLVGSVLVDVHGFSNIERRMTHFADRFDKESRFAFDRSCQNFVDQFDDLLLRPWATLSNQERAFALGYFCHLAADENWKQFDWDVYHEQGVYLWSDLPVSGDILLTVFDVESGNFYRDYPTVSTVLQDASISNVFSHVTHEEFQRIWHIIKIHVEQKGTLESFLEIQKRLGKDQYEVDRMSEQYRINWNGAKILLAQHFGGIEKRVESMVQQTLETVTHFCDVFET
jgi:hypothetical protein